MENNDSEKHVGLLGNNGLNVISQHNIVAKRSNAVPGSMTRRGAEKLQRGRTASLVAKLPKRMLTNRDGF